MNVLRPDERRLWMGRLEAIRRRRSVILGYHGIARTPLRHDLSRLQVRPSRFRAQIELLVGAGFRFVTVAELVRLAAGREPPAGYAAISFDDAMRTTFTAALPTLRVGTGAVAGHLAPRLKPRFDVLPDRLRGSSAAANRSWLNAG